MLEDYGRWKSLTLLDAMVFHSFRPLSTYLSRTKRVKECTAMPHFGAGLARNGTFGELLPFMVLFGK